MSKISITVAALVALVALPGMAMAQDSDNAALDQYIEGSPQPTDRTPGRDTAGGGGRAGGGGSGEGDSTSSPQPSGAAVAPAVETAPLADPVGTPTGSESGGPRAQGSGNSNDKGSKDREGGSSGDRKANTDASPDTSGVVGQALGTSDERGIGFLPLILGAVLVGAIAAAVAVRRRRGAGQSE